MTQEEIKKQIAFMEDKQIPSSGCRFIECLTGSEKGDEGYKTNVNSVFKFSFEKLKDLPLYIKYNTYLYTLIYDREKINGELKIKKTDTPIPKDYKFNCKKMQVWLNVNEYTECIEDTCDRCSAHEGQISKSKLKELEDTYEVKKHRNKIFLYYKYTTMKKEEVILNKFEYAGFSKLQRQEVTYLYLFETSIRNVIKNRVYGKSYEKGTEFSAYDNEELGQLVTAGRTASRKPEVVEMFNVHCSFDIFVEKELVDIEKINMVELFCYRDSKYYEPDKYKTFRYNYSAGVSADNSITEAFIREDYEEFFKIEEPKSDEIKKILDNFSVIPRNEHEKEYYKIILSRSIASMLKVELRRVGCNIFPVLIVTGKAGTGKSLINEICTSKLWNNKSLNVSHLTGKPGARIKDRMNDIRPLSIQEVTEFPIAWIDILKEGMTSGVFTFSSGRLDGHVETKIYADFIIDANDFVIPSEALESRALTFKNEHSPISSKKIGDAKKEESKEIVYVKNNIYKLGKLIYNSFKNYNIFDLWNDAKTYIAENNDNLSIRDIEKLAVLRVGENIVNDFFPFFKKIDINYKIFTGDNKQILNKKQIIKNNISTIFNVINIYGDNETSGDYVNKAGLTLNYLYNHINLVTELVGSSLLTKGVYFDKHNNLHLSAGFINILNNNINLKDQKIKILNLKVLAEILNIEYDNTLKKIYYGNQSVSKRGLMIPDVLLEDLGITKYEKDEKVVDKECKPLDDFSKDVQLSEEK